MVTTFYKKQFVFIIQILAVGIGLSLSLYASENSTAKKLKLKDLIQEALENNLGEQKNLLKQLVAVARSKYSVGKIPQAELLGFQIEQGKILGEILESEKEIKTKNAALNYVLGRKETWVQGKPEDIIKTPFERLKLNQGNALDKALQ